MVSLTADYALRAMLLLAKPENAGAIHADDIAIAIGAPSNYMAKVLNTVAKAGLITSMRGPSGGFTLAMPAGDITLAGIIDLFDAVRLNSRCLLDSGLCDRSRPCRAHDAWMAVTSARRSPFLNTTIADLLEGHVAPSVTHFATESLNVA